MWELHQQKAGGILADEMGLGKTIQVKLLTIWKSEQRMIIPVSLIDRLFICPFF